MQSPFQLNTNLEDDDSYKKWRTSKLQHAFDYLEQDINTLFVDINDADKPSTQELKNILSACERNNFCLYRINHSASNNKKSIHTLATHLGLSHLDNNICADKDNLTSITNTTHQDQHEYIPYSTKRLSWHTDGYYNTPNQNINTMLLHCSKPAKEGGESYLMDHEIAYILLRDENPAYIEALMQVDAMTIPANILNGKIIRKAQAGPVFSINERKQLHMRYSARKHNIEWKQTDPILEAVDFLEKLLNSESEFIIKHTLKTGEGLVCRNILHRRTSFVDYNETSKKRLLYRGRYFDTISPT